MRTLFTETQEPWLKYLLHFPAPYFAFGVSVLLELFLIMIFPHAGEQGIIGRAVEIVSPIIIGFWAGRLFYKKLPTIMGLLAWIPPAAILAYSTLSWQLTMSQYDSTWSTYFGSGCGGSECLYQLFVTESFYTAVAYSLGAATVRHRLILKRD